MLEEMHMLVVIEFLVYNIIRNSNSVSNIFEHIYTI